LRYGCQVILESIDAAYH